MNAHYGRSATGGIDPVLFGKSPVAAVPFGEASRFESLIERKPRAIHNGGVFEWCSAAFLHTRERLWPVAQKVFERLVPFRLVTGMAGDHQIGDPIVPPRLCGRI